MSCKNSHFEGNKGGFDGHSKCLLETQAKAKLILPLKDLPHLLNLLFKTSVLTFILVLLENKLQFNDPNNSHSIPFHFACCKTKCFFLKRG